MQKELLSIKSATAFRYYLRQLKRPLSFDNETSDYFYQLARIEQLIFNRQLSTGHYRDVRKHTRLITKNLQIAEHLGYSKSKIQKVANELKRKLNYYSPLVRKHVEKSFKKEVFEGAKQDKITKNKLPTRAETSYDIYETDIDYKGQAISKRIRDRDREEVGKEFDWLINLKYMSWREKTVLTTEVNLPTSVDYEVDIEAKGICPGVAIENTRDVFSWSLKFCPFFGSGARNAGSSTGGLARGQNKIWGIISGPAFYYHFGKETFGRNMISIGVEAPLIYRKIDLDAGPIIGQLSNSKFSASAGPALRFQGGPFFVGIEYFFSPLYEKGSLQFEFSYIF